MRLHEGKLLLDWDDVLTATSGLVSRMKGHNYQPKRILAVARGGLVPATLLAHLLDVRDVGSIQLSSYGDDEKQCNITAQNFDPCSITHFNRPDTLIVDDLWDTGETHKWLRDTFPQATTTTLFWKEKVHRAWVEHRIVSFPGERLADHWIVFPWE